MTAITPLKEAAHALEDGDLIRAEALIRARLDAAPGDAEALYLLAAIAAVVGEAADAEQHLRRSAAHQAELVQGYAELASLLCRLGRADVALALLDREIARNPADIWPPSIKSGVLSAERRVAESLDVHRALVTRAPDVAVLWTNYGHALKTLGQAEEAVVAYRRSLQCDPANGAAWWGLANLRTIPLSVIDIQAMEGALPQVADPFQKVQMLFALGKACGDQERFAQSFGYYREANTLRGALVPYDRQATREAVRTHEAMFTPAFFAGRQGQGHDADDAIFIVGMPRSGSSLVEQILASHPMIEGAGELFALQDVAGGMAADDLPGALARLPANALKAAGQRYLDGARRFRRSGRPRFTDKMPANWRFAALIHLILPNARIIDVRRDPMPCCFSAFSTYFNRESRFPASLDDLGSYYDDYVRMMDYMDGVLPGRVHRLRYERLIESPEAEIRRLLDHLGLPFDPCCLRFHENPRAVHTPSAQQVRVPINRSGLDRWRSYEPWLSPLAKHFGGVSTPGGD